MRRREFITWVGGAAAFPLATYAQQSERVRTLAVLSSIDESTNLGARLAAFQQELQRLGWIEGRNIRYTFRNLGDNAQGIQPLAAELVALAPDVIVTTSNLSTAAVAQQTNTVPIVFASVGDPVGTGLVASMARPGGNLTGFAGYEVSIGGKWLELLKEVVPRLVRVASLYTAGGAGSEGVRRVIEAAAPSMDIQVTSVPASDPQTIEHTIGALADLADAGLIVLPGPSTTKHARVITEAAARHHVPAIYWSSYFGTAIGGLMSYSSDTLDLYRRSASYVDRILRGEKPGDLPVQAPTKFNLVINLKIARTIGLTIPELFLLRADEVIE